ncbi:MAG: 3-hydroxyacyl-CoA dehydrogenase family protein, partial [Vulcanimicrobiaceae bacterium]
EGVPERLEWSALDAPLPADTRIAILGFDSVADELAEALEEQGLAPQRILNDDLIEDIDPMTDIVLDCGDGASDRLEMLAIIENALPQTCTLLVDAYTTDVTALRERMRVPDRVVGFGLLSGAQRQDVVEIVDADEVDERALLHARHVFATLGRHTVVVEDRPGLYLGRTVASMINEAVCAVHEGVATVDDVDRAMRLGTNYPHGPIAWGRQIGGARIARILERIAHAYGPQFAPHRALWVLDVDPDSEEQPEMTLGEPVL